MNTEVEYTSLHQIVNSKIHTLDQYPIEVLKTVFDNLTAKDLISCLGVCRSFNEIISESNKMMSKVAMITMFVEVPQLIMLDKVLKVTERSYAFMGALKSFVESSLTPETLKRMENFVSRDELRMTLKKRKTKKSKNINRVLKRRN